MEHWNKRFIKKENNSMHIFGKEALNQEKKEKTE